MGLMNKQEHLDTASNENELIDLHNVDSIDLTPAQLEEKLTVIQDSLKSFRNIPTVFQEDETVMQKLIKDTEMLEEKILTRLGRGYDHPIEQLKVINTTLENVRKMDGFFAEDQEALNILVKDLEKQKEEILSRLAESTATSKEAALAQDKNEADELRKFLSNNLPPV